MTTHPGCDAPNCKNFALVHIAAVGPIGQVDAFYCGTHADMFEAIFPTQRAAKALLITITDQDLRDCLPEVQGDG